jgi:hypothetical protein
MLRKISAKFHSPVPGRVGGGIKLRKDLSIREPTPEELQNGDNRSGVVLSKRVPEEFIQNTLLPHLEERMRMSIHVYTPAQLVQVARSYSKYTVDREDRGAGPLVEKLSETIKYRMPGFEAIDIIDILPAMLQLRPNDDELFGMLSDRMKEKIEDFNALNLVGVVRTYLKRGDVQIVKELLLPRLIESLETYDSIEVAEMLIAIGQATATDISLSGDMHILQCLIPSLEPRFGGLPLLVQLNVVWALAKMNVNHSLFRKTVIERFLDPRIVCDLPTKVFAKSCWIFARIGAFKTDPNLLKVTAPVIRTNRGIFNANEFARLVMAFSDNPDIREDLIAIANRLVESMNCEEEIEREAGTSTRKSRQEVLMLLSGLERLGLIRGPNDAILKPIESFIAKEESKFEPSEIQQIVGIFYKSPNNSALVDLMLPKTWKDLVDSSKKRIDQFIENVSV